MCCFRFVKYMSVVHLQQDHKYNIVFLHFPQINNRRINKGTGTYIETFFQRQYTVS